MDSQKFKDVDAYIAAQPPHTQVLLETIRQIIKEAAPEATEMISYNMPAYKLNGKILVYFAGYKHHIGFYPTGTGIAAFQDEFAGYKSSKGAVQFPVNQPLPHDLITRIVQFKMAENVEKKKK